LKIDKIDKIEKTENIVKIWKTEKIDKIENVFLTKCLLLGFKNILKLIQNFSELIGRFHIYNIDFASKRVILHLFYIIRWTIYRLEKKGFFNSI